MYSLINSLQNAPSSCEIGFFILKQTLQKRIPDRKETRVHSCQKDVFICHNKFLIFEKEKKKRLFI